MHVPIAPEVPVEHVQSPLDEPSQHPPFTNVKIRKIVKVIKFIFGNIFIYFSKKYILHVKFVRAHNKSILETRLLNKKLSAGNLINF